MNMYLNEKVDELQKAMEQAWMDWLWFIVEQISKRGKLRLSSYDDINDKYNPVELKMVTDSGGDACIHNITFDAVRAKSNSLESIGLEGFEFHCKDGDGYFHDNSWIPWQILDKNDCTVLLYNVDWPCFEELK